MDAVESDFTPHIADRLAREAQERYWRELEQRADNEVSFSVAEGSCGFWRGGGESEDR